MTVSQGVNLHFVFWQSRSQPPRPVEGKGNPRSTNPFGRTLTAEEAARFIADVDGLIAGTEPLTQEVLSSAKRLKVISRCGVGLDNVDLDAASRRDRRHHHVPSPRRRRRRAHDRRHVRPFAPHPPKRPGHSPRSMEKAPGKLLRGRTVGIVGLGRVGKAVVRALRPFHVKVAAYDPVQDAAFAATYDVRYTTFEELLAQAEIVSLHMPCTVSPPLAQPGAP